MSWRQSWPSSHGGMHPSVGTAGSWLWHAAASRTARAPHLIIVPCGGAYSAPPPRDTGRASDVSRCGRVLRAALGQRVLQALLAQVNSLGALCLRCGVLRGLDALLHLVLLLAQAIEVGLGGLAIGVVLRGLHRGIGGRQPVV